MSVWEKTRRLSCGHGNEEETVKEEVIPVIFATNIAMNLIKRTGFSLSTLAIKKRSD